MLSSKPRKKRNLPTYLQVLGYTDTGLWLSPGCDLEATAWGETEKCTASAPLQGAARNSETTATTRHVPQAPVQCGGESFI